MSTTPISPDIQGDDSQQPAAPVASAPSSNLGNAVSQNNFGANDADEATSATPSGGSRLFQILSAVAKVGSTALAGVPDKGRSSFVTGLGEGSRANLAAEATQQNIKFRTFDDQLRAAQLHNDDIRLQNQTQAQQDAHQKAWQDHQDWLNDNGYDDDTLANHGPAVMDHLAAQTSINGAATVPAGTNINPDGNTIHIPKDTQETRDAQKKEYDTFAPLFGLPSRNQNQDFVPGKQIDLLHQVMFGAKTADGKPITHDNLPGTIGALQAQRDAVASKPNTTPAQLQAMDNAINVMKTNLKYLDDHAASLSTQKKQAEKQGEINAENSPEGRALAASNEKLKEQGQDNSAGNRPQKAQNVDANGNPVWVPGVGADEKKKAELSENVVFNANNIASILQRRPDIVGKIAGRITTLDQMAGTNDPDITSLQQDMHNIAIANVGIHGMRANDAVHDVEKNILNNFKNGPLAIGGALKSTANSVQTFIDNARPATYKTHSKNGGALRAMVPNQ